jgi:sugar transferase EpsL
VSTVDAAAKRALDVATAALALLLASPLLAATALLVRWKMGPPVLLGQVRAGLDGEPFRLWKFRTMTDARDDEGRLLPDAARITPLGQALRRSSLDELPQLFNVLRGEMSLVGPRPLLMRYLPRYDARQRRRLLVKPGITGLAQVSGRNTLSWNSRLELDVRYVETRSVWLDLRILARTAWNLPRARGVTPELTEFWGTERPPEGGPLAFPVDTDETAGTTPGRTR